MVRSRAVLMVLVATSSTSAGPRKSKPVVAPAPAVANDTLEATPPPTSSHNEGEYGGVSPDHPVTKPDGKPTKKPSPGTLSWIGFEAKDGGAEIFLQSVNPFEISQYVAGSTLVVFTKLSRLGQNTWRDVDTRYFDSPVSHIVAKYVGPARATKSEPAHGAGVEVRVAFKNAKDAHEAAVRATTEADGLYYAYLTFGGGTAGN
jgi:hypothetical protein